MNHSGVVAVKAAVKDLDELLAQEMADSLVEQGTAALTEDDTNVPPYPIGTLKCPMKKRRIESGNNVELTPPLGGDRMLDEKQEDNDNTADLEKLVMGTSTPKSLKNTQPFEFPSPNPESSSDSGTAAAAELGMDLSYVTGFAEDDEYFVNNGVFHPPCPVYPTPPQSYIEEIMEDIITSVVI